MSQFKFRSAYLILSVVLVVPFFYNSCQGGLLSAKGFKSSRASSASCKMTMENGVAKPLLSLEAGAGPSAFQAHKVRLDSAPPQANATTLSKASSPTVLPSGSRLTLLIDNRCLAERIENHSQFPLSSIAIESDSTLTELDQQAYEWITTQSYNDNELDELSNQDDCVIGLSWNKTYTIQSTVTAASFNDPNISQQSHLNSIRAFEAYSNWNADLTKPSVLVAVIDSGIDWQHPDLTSSLWAHTNGIGIDITTVGTALVDYNPFDISDIGHGTHVAGLIAASSNNNIGGIGALPYRAKIMAIKMFKADADGNLTTTSQYFYNAVKFAYQNGARVINLSVGANGTGASTDVLAYTALEEATLAGSIVVTAMGNAASGNGSLIDGENYYSIPAQFAELPGVMAVGSYNTVDGNKSYFSHYSPIYGEIAAPGAEQGSTGLFSTKPRALSSYGRLAGTSQATPLVSAAAALSIAMIRDAYGISPSPTEIENLILDSASKNPALAGYFKDGNKLDMASLVSIIHQRYPLTYTEKSVSLSETCP